MLLDTLKDSSEPELPAWNELARDLGSCGSSTLKWRSLSSSKVTISNSYERNSLFFFTKFPLVSFFLNLHEPCPWINKSRALEGYLHLLLVTKIN